jgi:hypothetical protein
MLRTTLTTIVAAAALAAGVTSSASAAVTPGVQTVADGAQCTANFVFTDAAGRTLLGSAAHCVGTGEQTDTNGCLVDSLPYGSRIDVQGASQPATLVYSSWREMRAAGQDPASEACQFNDFALYELAPGTEVDPTIPTFGGPTGIGTSQSGDLGASYQNSGLRQGIALLSPKNSVTLSQTPEGWSYTVYTLTPGIPGDSGSGYLNSQGQAFGVLSTIALAPLAGSNGVSDLGKAVDFARTHGVPGLALRTGTKPFRARLLGLI